MKPFWRKRPAEAAGPAELRMIVGLGNPGKQYIGTRHNAGFRVVDLLAESLGANVKKKKKFGALFGEGEYANKKLIMLKPQLFMNCSGQVVATAVGFYRLGVGDLLVITDDMDLDVGRIRIRAAGSGGGHNGLADIIEKLGTTEFARLRIGIGQSEGTDAVEYVLGRASVADRTVLDRASIRAREAVLCWVRHGIEAAMNEFNTRQ